MPAREVRLCSKERWWTMTAVAEQIAWETSLPQAQERARHEGRAVLLDFSAAPE
jgi:hypothetical protein